MKVYRASTLLDLLRTALICSLVTAGLLIVGCDSGGSNEAEPIESTSPSDWTGKWKKIDPNVEAWAIYLSRSERRVRFKSETSGCGGQNWTVENISNGNVVKYSGLGGATRNTYKYILLTNGNIEERTEGGNLLGTYESVKESVSIGEVVGC